MDRRNYSYLCFGVAVFIFLFASVDTIELVADSPGSLAGEKALEVAEEKGIWPVLVNFRTDRHFGILEDATGSHLVRYVGVAYIGIS